MSFVFPLPKIWLEPCRCSNAVERHLATLGKMPHITKMDFDEGAARAIWHAHQALMFSALLRVLLAVLEMGNHVPSTVGF